MKNTPGRPSLGKSQPSSLTKSVHVKQQRPAVCKEEAGDSIEYATPAIASAALTRLQPTISPEESIARLISSKAACTSSPSTESALKIKSSLKRLRTVTHSEINAVVCGIAETRHAHVPPSALSVPTGIAFTSETVETAKEPDAKKCATAPYSAPPAIPEIEESTKIHVSLTSCVCSFLSLIQHTLPYPCLNACITTHNLLSLSDAFYSNDIHFSDHSSQGQ